MSCGCTMLLSGAKNGEHFYCKKVEIEGEKIACTPALYPNNKKKYLIKTDKRTLGEQAFCGRSDFHLCDADIDAELSSEPPSMPPSSPGDTTSTCSNRKSASKCAKKQLRGKCTTPSVSRKCALTCQMSCDVAGNLI